MYAGDYEIFVLAMKLILFPQNIDTFITMIPPSYKIKDFEAGQISETVCPLHHWNAGGIIPEKHWGNLAVPTKLTEMESLLTS